MDVGIAESSSAQPRGKGLGTASLPTCSSEVWLCLNRTITLIAVCVNYTVIIGQTVGWHYSPTWPWNSSLL